MEGNPTLAKDVYYAAENLLHTETIESIRVLQGYVLNGVLFGGVDSLQVCFEGTKPRLLKHLNENEYARAKVLKKKIFVVNTKP